MYAVIESGGRQYRVEKGSVIEVDRLQAKEGEKVSLRPVMLRDKDVVVDPAALSKAKVEAKVTGHLRGEKIRVFKYKAKKGYSRRAGHRAELTRLEVVSVGATGGGAASSKPAATKKAAPAKKPAAKKTTTPAKKPAAKKPAAKKPAAKKPATKKSTTAAKPKSSTTKKEQ
ncbi:MAG: 50S ribosomal protein L21 [Solirubrobacterales bacterium]